MAKKRIVILGAGGQAREVEWLIRDLVREGAPYELLGYAVSDLAKLSTTDSRERVLGDFDWLLRHSDDIDALTVGIGTPSARLRVAAAAQAMLPCAEWPALIHPSVILDRSTATIGKGVLICPGVVATVNLMLGDFAMCNFGCTIGHETRIGAGSVINPGANISGGVIIEEEVLIGTGAQVLQYLRIGAHATVAAGAVVTREVSPGQSVAGIPARPMAR